MQIRLRRPDEGGERRLVAGWPTGRGDQFVCRRVDGVGASPDPLEAERMLDAGAGEQLARAALGPQVGERGVGAVDADAEEGADGLPTRDVVAQQILVQKLEAASRRYMREMRRVATIDVKQP